MESGPDATIFTFGVFRVFDKAEPSRRAPRSISWGPLGRRDFYRRSARTSSSTTKRSTSMAPPRWCPPGMFRARTIGRSWSSQLRNDRRSHAPHSTDGSIFTRLVGWKLWKTSCQRRS